MLNLKQSAAESISCPVSAVLDDRNNNGATKRPPEAAVVDGMLEARISL